MDQQAMQIIRPEIDPGESVLWSSMADGPRQGFAGSGPQALIAIPFTGFSLFWTSMATNGFTMDGGFGWFGLFWGGMFIVVGLFMLITGLMAFLRGFRTAYAVTENRILIISDLFGRRIHSIDGESVGRIERTGGGKGSLKFVDHRSSRFTDRAGRPVSAPLGFYGIRDPKAVEATIRRYLLKS